MRRRDFILGSGATIARPLIAHAQQPAMPVIGWFFEVPQGPLVDLVNAAFRKGMAELGYVEGKNFAAELRVNPDSLTQAAANLVGLNVNVIFAGGPAVLVAASKATTSIPIVGIDLESDPVAKGYVKTLGRPGGNITGMFLDIPEVSGKQVQATETDCSPAFPNGNLRRSRPQCTAIQSNGDRGTGIQHRG